MRNGTHGITGTPRKVRGSLAFRSSVLRNRIGVSLWDPGINIPPMFLLHVSTCLSASLFFFFLKTFRKIRESILRQVDYGEF